MNKQPSTVRTNLLRSAFLVSLAFVIVMPFALGQRACDFQVLIPYADSSGPPTDLQSQILAEPDVIAVDLFDATAGTPDLGLLQQYNIVVPFSNSPFLDGDTLGNNLADYVDGGGIVVQYGFAHYGPGQPYGINGRWVTDGYNPYDYSTNLEFNAFSLGTFDAGHPLMAGVTTLNSDVANIVTPNAAATEVAQNNFGESLVAFRPVSGGHTTVGVTAYVGAGARQSGDWGRVAVNAGNWLLNCGGTLNLISAASVKGPFAIDLPRTGLSGVEDRSGGPNKKYSVVMTFDQNITSVGSASSTCGSVQSIVIDSSDPHKVNLNLVNVAHGCNGSTITVTADSITDDQGNVLDSASVGLGLLLGDVNADRVVNHRDSNEAQMHKGQKTDQENFRNDVNANGHIEQADIALIRQQQGTSLP